MIKQRTAWAFSRSGWGQTTDPTWWDGRLDSRINSLETAGFTLVNLRVRGEAYLWASWQDDSGKFLVDVLAVGEALESIIVDDAMSYAILTGKYWYQDFTLGPEQPGAMVGH